MTKLKIVEFLVNGKSVFRRWFDELDAHAAAKVTTALYRLEEGNFSNVKPVGKGISEYKINFGGGVFISDKTARNLLSCCSAGQRRLRLKIFY